jgi:ribosomal-protein-alanine N-acetyltransferase
MEYFIETDRLQLTPISEADISFILMLLNRYESYQYSKMKPQAPEDTIKKCRWYIDSIKLLPTKGAIRWIATKDSVKIGMVYIRCNFEETHEWEIGYTFLKEHWGNGFASEAVKAAIKYSFDNFEINRMVAFLRTDNHRSSALLRRTGMKEEGRLREVRLIGGKYYDEYVFSILKCDLHSVEH